MTGPSRPNAAIIPGDSSHQLIRGVLRVDAEPMHIARLDLLSTSALTLSVIDTGDGDVLEPSGDTTFHSLWAQDEGASSVDVNGISFPIVPGDTMSIPGGSSVQRSPGLLMIQIQAIGPTRTDILPPNHGDESFEGYNRRTVYQTPSAFSLERWKITQPLTVPTDGPYVIVSLTNPLALVWSGGTDLIGRGESRVIEPNTGPVTLLPDGLGYALIVSENTSV